MTRERILCISLFTAVAFVTSSASIRDAVLREGWTLRLDFLHLPRTYSQWQVNNENTFTSPAIFPWRPTTLHTPRSLYLVNLLRDDCPRSSIFNIGTAIGSRVMRREAAEPSRALQSPWDSESSELSWRARCMYAPSSCAECARELGGT
ncbi:hypothetical protein DFH09DRAFT_175095 [Mycena vulgaris]|nr:hypothetical protein DFH09DRAFT_175095 [Mycena vulgaris]